jgi:aspartyl protease family protein
MLIGITSCMPRKNAMRFERGPVQHKQCGRTQDAMPAQNGRTQGAQKIYIGRPFLRKARPDMARDRNTLHAGVPASISRRARKLESGAPRRLRLGAVILALSLSTGAGAMDVNVVGLFPNKAVVQIDGGALQTLSVGQKTAQGVLLVSVERDSATFDVEGQRMTLGLGHARMKASTAAAAVMVTADEKGQFVANGVVNGIPIRFTVDTGATLVALPFQEARRLGLDYRKGQMVSMSTANGSAIGYKIKLDTVQLGDITVNSVDAVIMDGEGLRVALLGMSFLKRMDIKREGEIMTLTKRY